MTRPGVRRSLSKNITRSALSIALSMCVAGGVQAQSAVGSIFGSGQPGSTIAIQSPQTGVSRSATAAADGRFSFSQLPPGKYIITSNGLTREVEVKVGSGAQVSLGSNATTLDRVEVVGAQAFNPIDVSSVESTTVFTADQMVSLPVASDVSSVALLAPGAVRATAGSVRAILPRSADRRWPRTATTSMASTSRTCARSCRSPICRSRALVSCRSRPAGMVQNTAARWAASSASSPRPAPTNGTTAAAWSGHRTGARRQVKTSANATPMRQTRCTNTAATISSTAPFTLRMPAARSSRTACSSLQWWKAARKLKTTFTR